MNKAQLKRRLVGAVVLVSLAVIFIPMMLDQRPDVNIGVVIPDRDAGPFDMRLAAERPEPIKRLEPAAQSAQGAAPSASPQRFDPNQQAAPAAGSTEPTPETASPQAWVVQVGSFGQSDNAEGLAGRLRAAGFDTVVEQADVGGSPVYRVQVGPTSSEARAEQLRVRISDKLKLDGAVLRHPAG